MGAAHDVAPNFIMEMNIEEEIKQSKFRSEQQKASINLLFTTNWLSNKHKDFFKQYDLTPQQFNVLRILRGQHPKSISTSDIKERMLDKNSDTSRIVDRLTIKKLVSKNECPSDRRLVDVIITKEGLKVLENMDDAINKLDESIRLNPEEAKTLNDLLDKLRG